VVRVEEGSKVGEGGGGASERKVCVWWAYTPRQGSIHIHEPRQSSIQNKNRAGQRTGGLSQRHATHSLVLLLVGRAGRHDACLLRYLSSLSPALPSTNPSLGKKRGRPPPLA